MFLFPLKEGAFAVPSFLSYVLTGKPENTFFAQYQIVQGNTAFCKVFLQEIPHLQTIYKLFLRQLSADAGDPFIRCQF